MEIFKLFPEKVLKDNDLSAIEPAEDLATYIFSVVWNRPEQCSLFFLNGRVANGTWHGIITNPIADNDGEISVKIGDFIPGTTIELAFGIQAITSIPKIATMVTNRSKNLSIKFRPLDEDFKKLEASETWQKSGNIVLP